MLGTLRKGLTASELSDELTHLVKVVRETGKKGALTIKFQLTPSSGGESVLVTADWSVKEPRPEKDSTTFFTTEDNALVRHDPRQREMFGVLPGQQPEEAKEKAS
ncbi:MAG TPA: hypothetical protein VGD41_18720 [Pyrinomonadaceae bacterium]